MRFIFLVLTVIAFALQTHARQIIETTYWIPKHFGSKKLLKTDNYKELRSADGKLISEYSNFRLRKCSYSSAGLPLREVDASDHDSTVSIYNADGKIIESASYNTERAGDPKMQYHYNQQGLPDTLPEQWINKMDAHQSRLTLYRYDTLGRLTGKTLYSSYYSAPQEIVYTYQTIGGGQKVVEYTLHHRAKKKAVGWIRYDAEGLTVEEWARANERRVRYEYEYNALGEWVIRRRYTAQELLGGAVGNWHFEGEYRRQYIED